MSAMTLVEWVSIIEFLLCGIALFFMWKRQALSEFPMLAAFTAIRFANFALDIPLLFFRKYTGVGKFTAFHIYMFTFWPFSILQAIMMVLMVYAIYKMALAPFEPLKKLGTIIFRWIAAISVAVSLGVAIGPHMFGQSQLVNMVAQMEQTASVLTLCLLLFVCIALRPLGLTFASRAFGASLGLGILATTQLVESAWFPTSAALSVYSIIYFYNGLGGCAALLVWVAYFALPEPERRMVLLPTTSPYFFWNKISEALNDAPGFVAISGFSPDSMAPGELDAMIMASTPREVHDTSRVMQPMAVNQ
jgi:hypothetical protein